MMLASTPFEWAELCLSALCLLAFVAWVRRNE